uniref:Uncharacterized protein n=1 Tax=Arundo donax TaxID=35708 RepID=A0A0A9HRU2_ARUDO
MTWGIWWSRRRRSEVKRSWRRRKMQGSSGRGIGLGSSRDGAARTPGRR